MSIDVLEAPVGVRVRADVASRRRTSPNRASPAGTGTTSRRSDVFVVEERWEGRVEEVCGTYFLATIENLATDLRASVRISSKLVSKDDAEHLRPGGLFYWHLGFQEMSNEVQQVSRLKFRRSVSHRTLDQTAIAFWLASSNSPE